MKKAFKARPGSIITDEDARLIGNIITEKFNDHIGPEQFLEYSRPNSSPTHKYFEWDDSVAGERYRLEQARSLISCLVVEIEGESTKAFHSVYVEELDKRQYVAVDKARRIPQLWEQVVDTALKEMASWEKRYRHYKELALIVRAIDRTRSRYGKTQEQRNRSDNKNT